MGQDHQAYEDRTSTAPADAAPEDAQAPSHHLNECGTLRVSAPILVLFALYGSLLIARSSIVVEEQRYFCLFDDAMISMTFARNWAQGNGLVWNAGETPVEGYTNFGWIVVMAAVHLLGLGKSATCLVMQIIGLVVGCAYIFAAARLGRELGFNAWYIRLGCLLTAAAYNLTYFTILGMETGILALIGTLVITATAKSLRDGRHRSSIWLLLAVGCVIRMDLVLLTAAVGLVLLVRSPKSALWLCACAALSLVPIIIQTIWRHSYYGEWLPNTYYAKVYAWPMHDRLYNGLIMTLGSIRRILVPATLVCVWFAFRPRHATFLILSACAVILLYQAWVGGDAWPRDRFLAPVFPALMVAASGAIAAICTALTSRIDRWRRAAAPFAVMFAVASAICLNHRVLKEALLFEPPAFTSDNKANLERGFAIERATDQDAVVGLFWAGAIPYYVERNYVDFLGKCDRIIAKRPARSLGQKLPPGHKKWYWPYAVGRRKPDAITNNRGHHLMYARSFQEHYVKVCPFSDRQETVTFWARRGSRKVDWTVIRLAADFDTRPDLVAEDP